MNQPTRRDFIKVASSGALVLPLAAGVSCREPEENAEIPFTFGMASYTFRNFGIEDTIAMTTRLGLEKISLKSFHLPLETSTEEIAAIAEKVRSAGLDLYGCGVVYMTSEAEVHRAFLYAQAAGMRIITAAPNHGLLGLVNEMVQQYDISLAIHNHGPGDRLYPTPDFAYDKIKNLDRRCGLCLDIGHTTRSGLDPCTAAERYADRLYDVHIKDVSQAAAAGDTVEIGRGVIDIPGFLRTMIKSMYQGVAAFEFEKDGDDPLPGVAESVGYVRGVLSIL